MEEVEPVGDISGPDVDDESELRIIKEVEFAAKCLVHGTEKISGQPRVLNLGYGRAVADLGRTTCIPCGHSVYVTIGLFETNWDKITISELQNLLRVAVLGDMISATDIPDGGEDEEEEDPTPAPRPDPAPTAGTSAPPSFGNRPRFRGSPVQSAGSTEG